MSKSPFEYFVWEMAECRFQPVGLRPSCIQGAHTHFPPFSPFGSIPHPLVLIHLRRSSSTTVSFHLMDPSLFQHVLHSTTWQVKIPLSFLLLTLIQFYYDVSTAGNSVAYALTVCSDKTGYVVCHIKYAVYRVAQRRRSHLSLDISLYSYRSQHNFILMYFWPCIMNWLYIDYQLDAPIIIYS